MTVMKALIRGWSLAIAASEDSAISIAENSRLRSEAPSAPIVRGSDECPESPDVLALGSEQRLVSL